MTTRIEEAIQANAFADFVSATRGAHCRPLAPWLASPLFAADLPEWVARPCGGSIPIGTMCDRFEERPCHEDVLENFSRTRAGRGTLVCHLGSTLASSSGNLGLARNTHLG